MIAIPNGEILRGLPHVYRFRATAAPDDTKTKWYGPDAAISKTAPASVAAGGANNYSVTVTPDETGFWALEIYDSSSNLLDRSVFNCVNATTRQTAMGVQNSAHALVASYPVNTIANPATLTNNIVNTGADARTYVSKGKVVIPIDGYIYGIDHIISVASPPSQLQGLRFGTIDPATGLVRGVSEDTHANWAAATGTFVRYLFRKPIVCRAGDWFFIEVTDSTRSKTGGYVTDSKTGSADYTAQVQTVQVKNAVVDLSSSNSFVQYGSGLINGYQFQTKLLFHPPTIAMAGHSFWASHPTSNGVYEDSGIAYSRANDLAAMVGDLLGVPTVNCADGGTNITQWVGATGLFETVVKPLAPSVMTYDAVYNDCGLGLTDAQYVAYLDRLLSHCDQAGIELVMLEAPSSYYAVNAATPFIATLERYNAIIAAWCQHHGVGYIPLSYRIGMYSGNGEHRSLRRYQKHSVTDLPDYDIVSDSRVHLSTAGYKACARAIADHFRMRRGREPRMLMPRSTLADVSPPYPMIGAGF